MMFRLIPCTMGANASQLEKDIGSDLFPANEHYFGLVSKEELATVLLRICMWLEQINAFIFVCNAQQLQLTNKIRAVVCPVCAAKQPQLTKGLKTISNVNRSL